MRRILLAVAALAAAFLVSPAPGRAAEASGPSVSLAERFAGVPAEFTQRRHYRRGYYRPRYYGRPRFYGRPRYYARPRFYGRPYYRPRPYWGGGYYRRGFY
ncbi:MAG: hypothetical protein JWR08_1698 [Enterovirga sp.]|nr:hypothetical protein [Enterovirga sp.]